MIGRPNVSAVFWTLSGPLGAPRQRGLDGFTGSAAKICPRPRAADFGVPTRIFPIRAAVLDVFRG